MLHTQNLRNSKLICYKVMLYTLYMKVIKAWVNALNVCDYTCSAMNMHVMCRVFMV